MSDDRTILVAETGNGDGMLALFRDPGTRTLLTLRDGCTFRKADKLRQVAESLLREADDMAAEAKGTKP